MWRKGFLNIVNPRSSVRVSRKGGRPDSCGAEHRSKHKHHLWSHVLSVPKPSSPTSMLSPRRYIADNCLEYSKPTPCLLSSLLENLNLYPDWQVWRCRGAKPSIKYYNRAGYMCLVRLSRVNFNTASGPPMLCQKIVVFKSGTVVGIKSFWDSVESLYTSNALPVLLIRTSIKVGFCLLSLCPRSFSILPYNFLLLC